ATDTEGNFDSNATVTYAQHWQKAVEFAGAISGAGTVTLQNATEENGTAYYKISGADNTFSGTYKLTGISNRLVKFQLTNETAAQNASVNLSTQYASMELGAGAVRIAGLEGVSGSSVTLLSGTTASTLTVNQASDTTFAGTIAEGISLTKTGAGTLTLSGTTSLGNLSVTDGKLALSGTANIAGTTTVIGGTLDISGATFTGNGAFELNGGNVVLGNVSLLGDTALLSASTITATSGTVELSGIIKNGTYTIFTGTSSANLTEGGISLTGTVNSDYTQTWAKNGNDITVTISGAARDLIWSGAASATWDTTSANWKTSAEATESTMFKAYDYVTFGTSGNVAVTVDSNGVAAGAVNITAGTVSFTGGSITAVDGVSVAGTSAENIATLKLTAAGNFASGTVITVGEHGVFDINGKSDTEIGLVLGGGTLTNTGNDVDKGNKQLTGGLSLTADSKVTAAHGISFVNSGYNSQTFDFGGFTLTKDGAGRLDFASTTLTNGTLKITEGTFGTTASGQRPLVLGAGSRLEVVESGVMDGTISSMAAGSSLTLAGTGDKSTITLSGSKSISGNLTIGNATVNVRQTDSLNYDASNTVTVNQGGVLDFGAYRWTVGSNNKIVLSGGTIQGTGDSNGALDFYRSATVEASEGTTSEISATVRIRNEVAGTKATFTVGSDAILTVSGTIKGAGALQKNGTGELVLSGTNTYTGGTTISAGTLVAAHASALGTGNVTVADGATLDARSGLQVGRAASEDGATAAIASTLTTEGSAKLVLGALNTTTAAIAAQGDVTLSAGTIFDVGALVEGGKVVSSAGTLTAADVTSGDVSGLGVANLYVGGYLANQRGSATFSVTDNALVLSAYTAGEAWNITWNGGDAGVWKANGSGWTKDGGSTAANFQHGDSVTFGTGTTNTATLEGSLNVGALTVSAATSLTGTGTVRVDAANLTTTAALTLGDNVVLDLGSISAATTVSNIFGTGTVKVVNTEGGQFIGVTLGEGFTGTIDHSGHISASVFSTNPNAKYVLSSGNMWGGPTPYQISNDIHFENYQIGNTGATTVDFTGALTQAAGTTLTIANANITFSGSATLGTLNVTSGTAKFQGASSNSSITRIVNNGTTRVEGGATLNITGTGTSDDGSLNWGTFVVGAGSKVNVTTDFKASAWSGSNWGVKTLTVEDGATLSVGGSMRNASGLTLNNGGLITAGTIDYSSGRGWSTNTFSGSGYVVADTFNVANVAQVVFENQTFVIGALTFGGSGTARLGNATFGAKQDWSTNNAFTLTGSKEDSVPVDDVATTTVFNTGAFDVGTKTFSETDGRTITLGGVLSGNGGIKKTGAGTLTLSGANTFTGGLTVTDGTLVVTQDAALGGDANAISVAENGTLELGFGGDFARSVSGAGTLATTADTTWTANAAFSGSFNVKGGTLELTSERGRAFNKLSSGAGATFKANQDVSFASVESFSGKLTGASASTRVSVSEGAFAGTLEHVSLVKTGATGTLDMSGASFATGGTLVVEGGTVSNLTLAGGGTLAFETTADASATMSNLTIYGGTTISIAEAFTGVAAASLTDTLTLTDISDTSRLTLEFRSIGFKEDYKVFTFTDAGKSAWETAFGTLNTTTGKFSSGNLTLAGIATDAAGKFSWQTNDDGTHTLLFQEDRDAETYYWRGNGDNPLWASEDNWNPNAFASGNAAVFDKDSLVDGAAFVLVDSSVNANSVTIDLLTGAGEGATGEVTIQEWDGGSMLVREGITVRSGVLKFIFVNEDFYRNAFIVEGAGVLHVTRPLQDVTLANDLSGTGVVRYADDTRTLTLSGDRSGFTGTLDVQAGTVVL
ncbi:MAG: beta strand repeat-containing protein, partial [Candidatus Spyradosoma sp.]